MANCESQIEYTMHHFPELGSLGFYPIKVKVVVLFVETGYRKRK